MKHVHFLGIAGSGASAAASLAQAEDFKITGCDLEPNNEFTTVFKEDQLLKGHSASHIVSGNVDILAVTPAIFSLDPDNSELQEAKRQNIPILTWQQFVGKYLMKEKFVIAICGTHGKTTTTAMVAKILEDANLDPTVLLGAIHPKWGANYKISKCHPVLDTGSIKNNIDSESEFGMTKRGYFVVEADEFNDNFLAYKPDITIVTNIEMDHPEYFADLNAYLDSFEKFFLQTRQTIVANLEDSNVAEIIKDVMKQSSVEALDFNKLEIDLDLKIPGEYNIKNAKAAFQVGLLLGIEPEIIRKSLNSYTGVGRRFEYIGEFNGAKIYSDFGHHPTEIKVTMDAAREKFPDQKITLIYQPHMFSRTKVLFDDFVEVFKNLSADEIFITDIYPSREVDTGLVTSKQLVQAINKPSVLHIGSGTMILKKIKAEAKQGDILFFMSAGDTDKWAKELIGK